MAWARQEQRLHLVCLALLCVLGSTYGAIGNAQEVLGPCDPSFVQQWGRPQVTPVAYRLADTTPEASPRYCAAGVVGPFELPADLTNWDSHSDRPAHVLPSP